MSNKQIAKRLFITERTVKTHIEHIFAKVGIKHGAGPASEVVPVNQNPKN